MLKCPKRFSSEMSEFHNQSRASARGSNYVWQYEYYDDDEPVSFEGLKAHRYSIVIGFWVGLAVFVIFMFFVLTLLTKTGAPHQENQDTVEKRNCPINDLAEVPPDPTEKVFSRPLLPEAHSFFHFYISEEEQVHSQRRVQRYHGKADHQAHREDRMLRDLSSSGIEEGVESERLQGHVQEMDRETALLSHFNIPNFVNSEHGSMLGDDDMLLCEPAIMPDGQLYFRDSHRAVN